MPPVSGSCAVTLRMCGGGILRSGVRKHRYVARQLISRPSRNPGSVHPAALVSRVRRTAGLPTWAKEARTPGSAN